MLHPSLVNNIGSSGSGRILHGNTLRICDLLKNGRSCFINLIPRRLFQVTLHLDGDMRNLDINVKSRFCKTKNIMKTLQHLKMYSQKDSLLKEIILLKTDSKADKVSLLENFCKNSQSPMSISYYRGYSDHQIESGERLWEVGRNLRNLRHWILITVK